MSSSGNQSSFSDHHQLLDDERRCSSQARTYTMSGSQVNDSQGLLEKDTSCRSRWGPWICHWKTVASVFIITLTVVLLAVLLRNHDKDDNGGGGGGGGGHQGSPAERACKVYCHGPVLQAVQLSGILPNNKDFVDRPMKYDPEDVLRNFHSNFSSVQSAISQPKKLRNFVDVHFSKDTSSLLPYKPIDFSENPSVVQRQTNETLRNWTSSINEIWLVLSKTPSFMVYIQPQRYSLLPSKHPLIIPGDRFRESYYWDTYWIVKGLQRSDMNTTARQLVENLLHFIESYGFVPNGGRVYYLTRSQPPLLSEMVMTVYSRSKTSSVLTSGNTSFLDFAGPLLEAEYQYFMDTHAVQWDIPTTTEILNRYDANTSLPRPESYIDDYDHAKQAGFEPFSAEAQHLYHQIATAAETGWDFSSRWLRNNAKFTSIQTDQVIPVELNTILYRMELNLALIAHILAETKPGVDRSMSHGAQYYIERANQRARTINTLLWDKDAMSWKDFIMENDSISNGKLSNQTTPANYVPIWGACGPESLTLEHECLFNSSDMQLANEVLSSLNSSQLWQAGGVVTSFKDTGQQWDKPNSWAPLNHWLIEGIRKIKGIDYAKSFAKHLASRWLRSNFIGFLENNGTMFEKYNAYNPGKSGHGGEYSPQVGFGWTNGAALDLLATFEFESLD